MEIVIEVLCGVGRPDSILTGWPDLKSLHARTNRLRPMPVRQPTHPALFQSIPIPAASGIRPNRRRWVSGKALRFHVGARVL